MPQANRVAVVLGGSENALGAIRSLKKAGVPTIVIAGRRGQPALLSRYPLRKIVIQAGTDWQEALLAALESLREQYPVLIPTADLFVAFMIRHRRRLMSRFAFCLPDDKLGNALLDKSQEVRLVESAGIPLPKTVLDLSGAGQSLADQLGIPLIIKPRRWGDAVNLRAKNWLVRSREELARFLEDHGDTLGDCLAQEVIPGGDENQWVCNCTFDRRHRLVCAFTFRRLRLSPAHRGVTSYAISETNRAVMSLAGRLGEALRYAGPAMIEFKYDERDRQYKYMELNPRIGLCNYFDTTCGVNNVYQTYRLAIGLEGQNGPPFQRDGVMYLSLFSDVYSRLEDGEMLLSILSHYLANAGRPHVGAYFDWRDPFPGLIMAFRHTGRIVGGAVRRITRKRGQGAG